METLDLVGPVECIVNVDCRDFRIQRDYIWLLSYIDCTNSKKKLEITLWDSDSK